MFHILNDRDIAVGVAREEHDAEVASYDRSVAKARDPEPLRFFYKVYADQTLRVLGLRQFDPDAVAIVKLRTNTQQPIVVMSSELR